MENSRQAREKAEATGPGPQSQHRSEKGTAGIIIAAETEARNAKTDRLRAARLARKEADAVPATAEPSPAKTSAKTTRAAAAKPAKKASAKPRKKAAAAE